MPKLSRALSEVSTTRVCKKCGHADDLARHHTGCERMWLRHFSARKHTKKYKDFHDRYHAFALGDIVDLCKKCHREIHDIYYVTICYYAIRHGKLSQWSWKRASNLMQMLREHCHIWLHMKPLDSRDA